MLWEDLLRLLAATIAGAAIGFERELHDKPAGFRTNIMICLGAALFTLLSHRLAQPGADPTRIAAQIVTGVGFLGAGAIIQFRGSVVGLTTAATIWTVASVGMAFGAGEFAVGGLGAGLACGVLMLLSVVEERIAGWYHTAGFEIEVAPTGAALAVVEQIITSGTVAVRSRHVDKTPHSYILHVVVAGAEAHVSALQEQLLAESEVRALRRT